MPERRFAFSDAAKEAEANAAASPQNSNLLPHYLVKFEYLNVFLYKKR